MAIVISDTVVEKLQTFGDLFVTVELNMEDDEAKTANAGKKAPRHYQNISAQTFKNAVLVDEGSYIQFKIQSRGEFGYGFRIVGGLKLNQRNQVEGTEVESDMIVKQLYCFPPISEKNIFEVVGKEVSLTDTIRRYQDKSQSIKIEGFKTLGWGVDDRDKMVNMMNCTVTSWEVYGFIDDATDIDYGHPADIGRVEWGPYAASREIGGGQAAPQKAAGGGPVRRGTSSQEFKTARQIREDNPNEAPNYVNFAFLIARP